MKIYNKIVRDKIPQIIESKGSKCKIRTLDEMGFIFHFRNKLQEEVDELNRAATSDEILEEVVDVLEILYTITTNIGKTFEDVEVLRLKKKQEKGGFADKLFLEYVN